MKFWKSLAALLLASVAACAVAKDTNTLIFRAD